MCIQLRTSPRAIFLYNQLEVKMTLPLAARQHFLENGYAILPDVIPAETVHKIRTGALAATISRSRYFNNLPTMESVLRCTPKFSDPLFSKMKAQVEKREYLKRYYREGRRQRRAVTRAAREFLRGRNRSQLSGDELWQLSEILAAAAQRFSGRGCTNTVDTDPQMLMAINDYRANAWMTNDILKDVLYHDNALKSSLSTLAEIVGGVEKPVVFGDAPLLRERFGNSVAYQATAPLFGTHTNHAVNARTCQPAVTLVLFTYTPSATVMAPHVLTNSHHFVRQQYVHRVAPRKLFSPFQPLETHIPSQVAHFLFDATVVGKSLVDGKAAAPKKGSVMVLDPHLMVSFGPNYNNSDEVIYRLNIVSESAKPYLQSPSWVRGWRSMPHEVHFASPVVFPPLYH